MQDYLNEEEEEDSLYNSDEKVSDEVNDFDEDDDTSDDDFDSDSTEGFEETTVEETPEETESQNDEIEEPAEDLASSDEFPEVDAPENSTPEQPQDSSQGGERASFRVMSFQDFLSEK